MSFMDDFKIKTDESIPVNSIRVEHGDGRMDSFMIVEGKVVPIHLTKLGDPPNWACPACSFVNEKGADACACCGISI